MNISPEQLLTLPQQIISWGGAIAITLGFLYQIFTIQRDVKDHQGRLKELEEKNDNIKNSYLVMQNQLSHTLTDSNHRIFCIANSKAFCKKVDELKAHFDEKITTVNQLREDARKEQQAAEQIRAAWDIKIAGLLGRVEEHLDNNKGGK